MIERRNQVLVGFRCDQQLREEIARVLGGVPISQWLREAAIEKLQGIVGPIDPRLAEAPSRLGKGGPKPKFTMSRTTDTVSPPVTEQRIKDLRYEKAKRPKKGPKK